MTQKLSRRLEELEKVAAGRVARVNGSASADSALAKVRALLRVNNVQQEPNESLADTFARFLGITSGELRDRLMQRAYGSNAYLGGL